VNGRCNEFTRMSALRVDNVALFAHVGGHDAQIRQLDLIERRLAENFIQPGAKFIRAIKTASGPDGGSVLKGLRVTAAPPP
jgi:hypothetical protein